MTARLLSDSVLPINQMSVSRLNSPDFLVGVVHRDARAGRADLCGMMGNVAKDCSKNWLLCEMTLRTGLTAMNLSSESFEVLSLKVICEEASGNERAMFDVLSAYDANSPINGTRATIDHKTYSLNERV